MNDHRHLTVDEILSLVRHQVAQLCGESCHTYIGDVGELDSVLFTWHWLYATATGRMDDFVKAIQTESPDDFLRLTSIAQSHEAVDVSSENTQAIIERWRKRGEAIGLIR